MNFFYIIPDTVLPEVSRKCGMSMGVLTDVLESYADKVVAPTAEDAVINWLDDKNKEPKKLTHPDKTFFEIWDKKFKKVRFGFFLGLTEDYKYVSAGIRCQS